VDPAALEIQKHIERGDSDVPGTSTRRAKMARAREIHEKKAKAQEKHSPNGADTDFARAHEEDRKFVIARKLGIDRGKDEQLTFQDRKSTIALEFRIRQFVAKDDMEFVRAQDQCRIEEEFGSRSGNMHHMIEEAALEDTHYSVEKADGEHLDDYPSLEEL